MPFTVPSLFRFWKSLNGYWNSHYSTISLGFFFTEFRITTAHCWTVYCDFVLFFQCRAKLTLQYLSETFYFSVIFEWLPDYSWHLLIFFPLSFFSFHLTLFFFITFCSNLPLSIVFTINSISQASPFWGLFAYVFAYNFFSA